MTPGPLRRAMPADNRGMELPTGRQVHGPAPTTASDAGGSWQRWLLAALAGTLGFAAVVLAIQSVAPGLSARGNTGLYAEMVIALLVGTVVAGLTVRARTAKRWAGALLLVVLTVAGLWLLFLTYAMMTVGI